MFVGILKANKSGIKELYIAELRAAYPFYTEGSRALNLAERAADSALAGLIKLDGECWFRTLETYSLPKNVTMRDLAELPETAHD